MAQYTCMACYETFNSSTDHMIHYTTAHHVGRLKRSDLMKREISCRSCAKRLRSGITVCDCGWELNPIGEGK